MISKIAGFNDFQKLTEKKLSADFIKRTAEKVKQVTTDNNIQNQNLANPKKNEVIDFFTAESFKSIPKKLALLKKQK